jgi:hypothetical protein
VLSAALRSPAVVGGVPQFAVSALAFALGLYAVVVVGGVLAGQAPQRAGFRRLDVREPSDSPRRRAA